MMELPSFSKLVYMDILERLEWRYATKKFDPTKKLSEEQLDKLLAATRLSASSFGLQPYKIIVIENAAVREKLKAVSNNQAQITDASHLVIFARHTDLGDKHVDAYINNIAGTRNIAAENLEGFSTSMKGIVKNLGESGVAVWTSKQAYIALGTLLTAAAVEGIDTCPMEGFNAAGYDDILELKERGLSAVVIAAIGFRASDDTMQHARKVRKPLNDLVEII